MPRKKRYFPRRRTRHYRPRFRGFFRRHKPKTIPLLPTAGFATGLLFGTPDTWTSPVSAIQMGKPELAIQTGIRNLTGIKVPMAGTGYNETYPLSVDIWRVINPFDFGEAPALKGLIWGGIASTVLRYLGINRKYKAAVARIPFLNKTSL
jgi:hypothetical protein